MMKKWDKMIRGIYNTAAKLATTAVVHQAKIILKTHKNYHSFVMGMGVASFYRKDNTPIMYWEKDYTKTNGNLDSFIGGWDAELHITGASIEINKKGVVKWN